MPLLELKRSKGLVICFNYSKTSLLAGNQNIYWKLMALAEEVELRLNFQKTVKFNLH